MKSEYTGSGEIEYRVFWWNEEKSDEEYRKHMKEKDLESYGASWKEYIDKHEEDCMKQSDAGIDRDIIPFDTKRVFVEVVETDITDGMGIALLKKLAKISRGFFQPADIREEISE